MKLQGSRTNRAESLSLSFVEGDEPIKDPTKGSVQRPRVFYRRELESLPMIVGRPLAAVPARN